MPTTPVEVDWKVPDGYEDVRDLMVHVGELNFGLPFALVLAACWEAMTHGQMQEHHVEAFLERLRVRLAEVVTRGVANA